MDSKEEKQVLKIQAEPKQTSKIPKTKLLRVAVYCRVMVSYLV